MFFGGKVNSVSSPVSALLVFVVSEVLAMLHVSQVLRRFCQLSVVFHSQICFALSVVRSPINMRVPSVDC